MKLSGKVALVTGAGSGIGRAIARRFAAEGARVFVNDINPETARATAGELGERGVAVPADVADSAAVRAMFETVGARLDVLVNNAGIAEFDPTDAPRINACLERRVGEQMSGATPTPFTFTRDMPDAA